MQTSQESESSDTIHSLYHQPMQQIEPCCFSHISSQGTSMTYQTYNDQFFTLESSPAPGYVIYDSPSAVSISSNRSPYSPHCSQSYLSDQHQSPEFTYGSPLSGSSMVDDGNEYGHMLRELEMKLLGPESFTDDHCNYPTPDASLAMKYNHILQMNPGLDLKEVLLACAEAASEAESEADMATVNRLMDVLERMVSVTGEPIQRLGAYMLEGIRARLISSGSVIYKNLKCKEPTSSELMSSMRVLYDICPYYKFAYTSSNVAIEEAVENEPRIHIIDFCIAQGSQWMFLMKGLARRPGGPPHIRITGVDDTDSSHARGGGLHLVGQRLSEFAESCGVPFEFHGAAMSGCKVERDNLRVRAGEALAVNFPYMLHHMPDESVSTQNHRDRLLRLIKSFSPKIVTLLEQESNTNTASFFPRFRETLDYYAAMFESIDAARPRDDKQRISAEEHCVARDIVNIIACEGADRVERHEPFGKWRSRLTMAGFTPCPLSSSVAKAVRDMLKDYSGNYGLAESYGALFLGWKNRPLSTCSAWR
ncbi:hypothetical protein RJ640_010160 [Escallonia rubra]|uniref:Scarecrow-like protein 13 n=1 Tax=Escallonia rubra TaxID=112253 RepID=A0AA88QWX0_9ASTE|nr:hypothetical protein RJ640_010160 [Escallonia rubra]